MVSILLVMDGRHELSWVVVTVTPRPPPHLTPNHHRGVTPLPLEKFNAFIRCGVDLINVSICLNSFYVVLHRISIYFSVYTFVLSVLTNYSLKVTVYMWTLSV